MKKHAVMAGVVVSILAFAVTFESYAQTPLDTGNWTQVGNMSSAGGMFNGNCNLASGCNYGPDLDGDFWTAFETFPGQEILFITGDRKVWAVAGYESVVAIIGAKAGVFTPNITWSDAGLGGASLGAAVVGNILQRESPEDPWVTLRGSHCAHLIGTTFPSVNDCNLILWGETDTSISVHVSLKNYSGGVEVYVSTFVDADGDGFSPDAPERADCDDNDADINPDAAELPGNFVDENCDGDLGVCDPCGELSNHGQYVRCVAQDAEMLVLDGILTEEEGDALVTSAAQSSIGKKGFVDPQCVQ